jgi:replicative DNA helicase
VSASNQVPRLRSVPTERGPDDLPPHAIDAEEACVSACLIDGSVAPLVFGVAQPEHFYGSATRAIAMALHALCTAARTVDAVHVGVWLRENGMMGNLGPNGLGELARIVEATPAIQNAEDHARIVFDRWRLRQAIEMASKARAEMISGASDTQETLDLFAAQIGELATSHAGARRGGSMRDAAEEATRQFQAAVTGGHSMLGISTGFRVIDDVTAGLVDESLYVLAGGAGMGKTSLAMAIAANVADQRRGVLVLSLEMSRTELATRMLCAEAMVDVSAWRKRCLTHEHLAKLNEAGPWVGSLPIWIEDTPEMDVAEMKSAAMRQQRLMADAGTPLGLVVVDYLQLAKAKTKQRDPNREQIVSAVARGLKNMAKSIRVPIIVCSSTSNDTEKDQRLPRLTDLRDSGEIGFAADFVGFVHPHPDDREVAALIVRKNRGGPTGPIPLSFNRACVRFRDLNRDVDVSEGLLIKKRGGRNPEDKYAPRGSR